MADCSAHLLGSITLSVDLLLAELGVVVEADLRVDGADVAIDSLTEGVDLQQLS